MYVNGLVHNSVMCLSTWANTVQENQPVICSISSSKKCARDVFLMYVWETNYSAMMHNHLWLTDHFLGLQLLCNHLLAPFLPHYHPPYI